MNTTEERIAKLERSTARWRFATVGMVGVLAAAFMAGLGHSSKALSDLEIMLSNDLLIGSEPKVAAVVEAGPNLVRVYTNGYTEALRIDSVFTNSCSGGFNISLEAWVAGCPDGNWNPVQPYSEP